MEEAWEVMEMTFRAYILPLTQLAAFKYLLFIIMDRDDDWPEVVDNLSKARKDLDHKYRILGQEGVNAKRYGKFYKGIVQAVLLFVLEMWMVNPHFGRLIGNFQHRVERQLIGKQPRRFTDSGWD